jgi:hypothetical protein
MYRQKTKSCAMKIQKQLQTITPFAEISFIIEEFNNFDLSNLIDNNLDERNLSGYQLNLLLADFRK